MAPAEAVRQALQQLLPSIDLATTTERKIREELSRQLGPVDEFKALIKVSCRRAGLAGAG